MSTMTSRERMLGRLRAAAPAASVDGDGLDARNARIDARIDSYYDSSRTMQPTQATRQQLVDAMQAAMSAAHAEVWCSDNASWPAQLAHKLASAGVKRLLLDPASVEGAALSRALPPEIQALSFAQPLEAWKSELFDTVDAGFTVARSGIAATGTLILAPDAGTPRTVSLVPPLHIALVHARTLHPDLHAAVRAERWRDGMPANLVLASGPSKTSDIQQTLAFGAHGPRWMWVIIVTGEDAQ